MQASKWMIGWMFPALLGIVAAASAADVQGTIIKKEGGQVAGIIRYQPSSKSYLVSKGAVSLTVPLDQVDDLQIPPPPGWEAAIKQVSTAPAAAIAALEGIMSAYTMLKWDADAAKYLAEAYLKANNPQKALQMCETVLQNNPSAQRSGEFCAVYWQLLLQNGLTEKLRRSLTVAIQEGNRELAAVAYLRRGDMEKKAGNVKNALVDGYLRTALMFADIKSIQPEALYSATKCFEELGQATNAERMRKKLLAEYPQSPYAQKISAGS